jgi:nucleoside-diphosphate-sugar epimerase
MRVCVTGGAGYIGAGVVAELLAAGHEATVLDNLAHGQHAVAAGLAARGAVVITGDVRDAAARRRALAGADAVVHLAAIVGDPACAANPELARAVNVEGSRALLRDAAGAGRFVFASTCSNYGRMAAADGAVDETAPLRPVSLYARQKVTIEQALPPHATGLRFATVYGVAERMRFDLTVNQFTRDLWLGRPLQVFGEQFWRPYIHVHDVARAVRLVLSAPEPLVAGRVFNVGDSDENYRKLDLVELIVDRLGRGDVTYVHRDEDPRDYRVDFSRIRAALGFVPAATVADGVDELIAALERGRFDDPDAACFANA